MLLSKRTVFFVGSSCIGLSVRGISCQRCQWLLRSVFLMSGNQIRSRIHCCIRPSGDNATPSGGCRHVHLLLELYAVHHCSFSYGKRLKWNHAALPMLTAPQNLTTPNKMKAVLSNAFDIPNSLTAYYILENHRNSILPLPQHRQPVLHPILHTHPGRFWI